ncbi:type II secretion system protein N [uncultured Tateyamaria sp.]|uniref:type II secretion system protein N n=1 Tax=Tateyamaria sp. 1078 TaxID=3417464 RepID=UPI002616FA1F|nr:type II secretion system protein N [uncultured Tateyamaria sp.]
MTRSEALIRLGCVAVAMASVVWTALPTARHMAGVIVFDAPPPVDLPISEQVSPVDLTGLLKLAPFGRAAAQDQPRQAPSNRPEIVLRGIFAAREGASTALLDVAGAQGLYRERMRVADLYDVTRIAPDRVELMDGETVITLRFDVTETEAQSAVAAVHATPSLAERLQGGFVVAAKYEKPGPPETTSDYIDYWRHRIRKNPQAVLDEIGLKPSDAGYVIADKHDVGVRLAGLRSGDLVRAVNGEPVGDPDADRRFYDKIAAAGQARIEVERDGRILSFSFPLR